MQNGFRRLRPARAAYALAASLSLSCAVESPVFAAEPGPVVQAGAGGYLTERPKHCKALPEKIFKSAEATGPTLTHQWWSSLLWQPYSQNMFSHPLVLRCDETGLLVGTVGTRVHGNAGGIFGGGAGKDGDFVVGHSAAAKFPEAVCGGWSDWFVKAAFTSGGASLKMSFGHGSPYAYGEIAGGDPQFRFIKSPKIRSGDASSAVLAFTTFDGRHYALFGPTGSTWEGLDGLTWTNRSGKGYFSLSALPDDAPETLVAFTKYAHSHVVDTRMNFRHEKGVVRTDYEFVCKPREGSVTGTLTALYPHQWKYATTPLGKWSYGSVRGTMKVVEGNGFSTAVPVQGVLPQLPTEGIADRERTLSLLRAEAAKPAAPFADTYWEGKHLGRLTSLCGVAEAAGAPELREQFAAEIKRRLENWFTAQPNKDQPVFYYEKNWGTLIGSKPSYGSDRPLNDHHFHYGYFIRAAAEIARRDPAWADKWGPMVELLIRDIASPDRRDPLFPHLRCFDKYAGHSWASGDANFADGNNQESSSESLNAWYGLMLWGEAVGDAKLRDTGVFLFNTERTAIEEYWFDVAGTNYPQDFPRVALGMVWGGKGAFGTWFSADIDCIHGINWLPFTPASVYMGRHPEYVKKNHDRIVAERKGKRDYDNGWGDLVVMFYALHDPAVGAEFIAATPDCKLEGGNSHAFMGHWIGTLSALGRISADVTADHPFTNVYMKDGKKTYVAYHFGREPLSVKFSDGTTLQAAPGKLTVK